MVELTKVVIYCDAQSHSKRRTVGATFTRDPIHGEPLIVPGRGRWTAAGLGRVRPHERRDGIMINLDRDVDVAVGLDRDGRVAPLPTWQSGESWIATRTLVTIECPLCPLNLDIRGERLEPLLDLLHGAGQDEVSLRNLIWLQEKRTHTDSGGTV